jgi:hypothetical protein
LAWSFQRSRVMSAAIGIAATAETPVIKTAFRLSMFPARFAALAHVGKEDFLTRRACGHGPPAMTTVRFGVPFQESGAPLLNSCPRRNHNFFIFIHT